MSTKARIAIVDDDRGMREALKDLVASLGYVPRCFASSTEFLAAPDLIDVDCAILDIKMPGMSGLELQEVLGKEARSFPIIFLSSFADEAIQRRASEKGARCVLTKPVDDGSLIECIEIALGNRA